MKKSCNRFYGLKLVYRIEIFLILLKSLFYIIYSKQITLKYNFLQLVITISFNTSLCKYILNISIVFVRKNLFKNKINSSKILPFLTQYYIFSNGTYHLI